jgi:hypothetical protein
MGKRELVIAAAFAIIGLVAYWITAGPADETVAEDSLPALVDEWRASGDRSAARESVQTIGTIPLAPQVTELRVAAFTELRVTGEARADVSWTLQSEATGASADGARKVAAASEVRTDDLGEVVVLSPSSSDVMASLTLRVPTGLLVRIEDARRVNAAGVARVRLEAVNGEVTLSAIDAVTGSIRAGSLQARDLGEIDMGLVGTRADVRGVRREAALTLRAGECRLEDVGGPVSVDATNSSLSVTAPGGIVRINATGGSVAIDRPAESVHVSGRNATVDVGLTSPVAVTIVAIEGRSQLRLTDALPISIDAVAVDGSISSGEVGLMPTKTTDDVRLTHVFGTRARASLRSTRGSIVIARRK